MILVGMTGPIGHGKTTFAEALKTAEPNSEKIETSDVISEVVEALNQQTKSLPLVNDLRSINKWLEALPPIISRVLHQRIDWQQLKLTNSAVASNPGDYAKLFEYITNLHDKPQLLQQTINEFNKKDYRNIQQWLGGYLVTHVDTDIWYNEILRRSKLADKKGLRLYIIGGVRFLSDAAYVHRAGGIIVSINRPNIALRDIDDPTERERSQIITDTTVLNDASVEQLLVVARRLWLDIQANQLQPQYRASQT